MHAKAALYASIAWHAYATTQSPGSLNRREITSGVLGNCQLKSPLPEGHECGSVGRVTGQSAASTGIAKDLGECQRWCMSQNARDGSTEIRGCAAFAYNLNSTVCSLYYPILSAKVEPSSDNPDTFYEWDCFQCDIGCPQKPVRNLVINGGFEQSSSLIGPWSSFNLNFVSIVPGIDSPNAVSEQREVGLGQQVGICPKQIYYYSLDLFFPNSTIPNDTSHYYFYTQDIAVLRTLTSSDAQKRYSYAATFAPTNGPLVEPYSEIYPTGNISYVLDNVVLLPVSIKATQIGSNLVKNGGFEAGNLSHWDFSLVDDFNKPRDAVKMPGLTEGKYQFAFHQLIYYYCPYNQDRLSAGYYLKQTIPTVAGKWYQISFDYLSKTHGSDNPDSYRSVTIGDYEWKISMYGNYDHIRHFSATFKEVKKNSLLTIQFASGEFEIKMAICFVWC